MAEIGCMLPAAKAVKAHDNPLKLKAASSSRSTNSIASAVVGAPAVAAVPSVINRYSGGGGGAGYVRDRIKWRKKRLRK